MLTVTVAVTVSGDAALSGGTAPCVVSHTVAAHIRQVRNIIVVAYAYGEMTVTLFKRFLLATSL